MCIRDRVEAVLECNLEFQFVMMRECRLHQRHAARFRERRDIDIDQHLCCEPDLYDANILYEKQCTVSQLEAVSIFPVPRPKGDDEDLSLIDSMIVGGGIKTAELFDDDLSILESPANFGRHKMIMKQSEAESSQAAPAGAAQALAEDRPTVLASAPPPPPGAPPAPKAGPKVAPWAEWQFKDGHLTGKHAQDAEELPWKDYDEDTTRALNEAWMNRSNVPKYSYTWGSTTYEIDLSVATNKMFQLNTYNGVKRPVRRIPYPPAQGAKATVPKAAGPRPKGPPPMTTTAVKRKTPPGIDIAKLPDWSDVHTSPHQPGPHFLSANDGQIFNKLDIENMLFDVVMYNEGEFKFLQVPWHFGEESLNRTVPALNTTGQVDEYLLKVLSKLMWFKYTVNDVGDIVLRDTDMRHKVKIAQCVYQDVFASFNESDYVIRVLMYRDIIRGENKSGEAIKAWIEQMDQQLPEQYRAPDHVLARGFIRARTDMKGNPMAEPSGKVPKLDLTQLQPRPSADVVLDVPSSPAGPPSKASRSSQGGSSHSNAPWEPWEEVAAAMSAPVADMDVEDASLDAAMGELALNDTEPPAVPAGTTGAETTEQADTPIVLDKLDGMD